MRYVATAPLRLVLLAGLLACLLPAADSDPEYRWRILPSFGGDNVNLTLTRRVGSSTTSHSSSVPLSSLQGLERMDMFGGATSFRIRRDAGTLYCKGGFTLGAGMGTVDFQPDPQFTSELKEIGLREVPPERLFDLAMDNFRISTALELHSACKCVETVDDVMTLSNHGVDGHFLRQAARSFSRRLSIDEVTAMRDHGVQNSLLDAARLAGYQFPPQSVIELQDHGVDAGFIREMGSQFKDSSDLIALHDHGVSAEFVRRLRESGANPSVSEIVQLHDHGADASLVRTAKAAGLDGSPATVIALHDHGLDPAYVREMTAAVHAKLDVNELIRLHDHGVSPDFARRIVESGFEVQSPEKLIGLHEHGVPVELVAQVVRSRRAGFSIDDIISLHDHGVDAEFLRSFDAAGYATASPGDLIQLHDHGVTADYARRMQAEGFGPLSVSQLIKIKEHGI